MKAALGAIAVLALATTCSGAAPRGVSYNGQRLAVLDMHLHPGEWEGVPPGTQRFLASRFPFPLGLDAESTAQGVLSPEGILSEMDAAGVSAAGLFAIYAPRTVGITTNELVAADVATDRQRLYGLASLRIDRWNSDRDAELRRLRTALGVPGMVGVKLAHAHQHFRFDDPRYDPIYALAAELAKPVYLHTGTSPFPGTAQDAPYTDPAWLEDTIRRNPRTRFVLGHLGYDFTHKRHAGLEACLRLARMFPNVFLEPSALGSNGSDPTGDNLRVAMRRMREAGLVDRILYGSDGPQSPGFVGTYLARTVAAMQAAGYTVDEARAVLTGNFARVFAVPEPTL